jgi:hypothetical protein
VIEFQQSRPTDKRPNDIVQLATVAGLLAGVCITHDVEILTPLPREWKGTVPKEVHQKRIIKGLTEDEIKFLNQFNAQQRKDILDAIGLAKWNGTR